MQVAAFTFNAFQENSYIIFDDTKEAVVIDPGCNSREEQKLLSDFISAHDLDLRYLLNTHCHIDHVLGNKFVSDIYKLPLTAHRGEIPVLAAARISSDIYSIYYEDSPPITMFLEEGDELTFGNIKLKVLFTPGHSPASISFLHEESKQLISGDVLFEGSIGRTDLPGGDMDTLIKSIKEKLMTLDDETIVYSGHGPSTTIGKERQTNPFLV